MSRPFSMRPTIRRTLLLSRRPIACRRYVTDKLGGSNAYHQKVCALPFTVSPDEALEAATSYVADELQELPDQKTVMNMFLDRMGQNFKISELISTQTFSKVIDMTKELSWNQENLTPMYLPSWLVNGCVTVKYELRERGEVEQRVFGILDAPIPGHGFPPLANLWLSEPWLPKSPPQPFSPSMLTTKWGETVSSTKFTVSPLKMIEMLTELAPTDAEFRDLGITIAPGTKLGGVSALPLLRPVYISTWILPHPSRRATLVIPGWVQDAANNNVASSLKDYVYRPRDKKARPDQTYYYSPVTDANSNVALTMAVMHDVKNTRSHWENIGPKLVDVMRDARQNRIDWSSIGGVDDEMWEDDRIVTYDAEDWKQRKIEVTRVQQSETLKNIFRDERTDLSEAEVERKADTLSKFIDKLRNEGKPLTGLDLEDMEKAAEKDEDNERKAKSS